MKKNSIDYKYNHPLGILELSFDKKGQELIRVSYTPTSPIDNKKTTSIDWYFKDGQFAGWGTGLAGYKN